jgi:hypothetical protein
MMKGVDGNSKIWKSAIKAFKEKAVGINAASRDFGIPSRTLRRRIFRITTKNLSVQVRV